MRNNETGEFELVVGNRQLLSGFFIVVLLFAVAFAMGYVVGQNSRAPKPAEAAALPGAQTASAEKRPQPGTVPPMASEAQPAAPAESAQQPPADTSPQPTTQPAREPEREAAPAQPAPAPSAPPPQMVGAPASGNYWQVNAMANKEAAQMMVQSLRDKGFPALLSPGPNSLTRVLVGPYSDTAAMGRAKTELEGAGFMRLVKFTR